MDNQDVKVSFYASEAAYVVDAGKGDFFI